MKCVFFFNRFVSHSWHSKSQVWIFYFPGSEKKQKSHPRIWMYLINKHRRCLQDFWYTPLKLTGSHLKMDGWNTRFLLGFGLFSGANFEQLVSGRVCHGMFLGGKDAHMSPIILNWKSRFFVVTTRWAPTSYKCIYNPYKWSYKWVTGVITLHIGIISPFITSRGPPCMKVTPSETNSVTNVY